MAAGYAFGPIFRFDRADRMRWLIGLGAAVMAGFIALRVSNLYGDPAAWVEHDSLLATVCWGVGFEKKAPARERG